MAVPSLPSELAVFGITSEQNAILTADFGWIGPDVVTITDVSPSSGIEGDEITITGTNFEVSQGGGYVLVGGANATVKTWSDTEIVVYAPAGAGTVDVYVKADGGGWDVEADAFSYAADKVVIIRDAADPQNSYSFEPIELGYEVRIRMNKRILERSDGTYGIYDYGATYDSRQCTISWIMTATDANDFLTMMNDKDKSRAKSVEFILPVGSGIYLFGPDYGDTSTAESPFQARMINISKSAGSTNNYPGQRFNIEATFLLEARPDYTISGTCDEGTLQIGTIDGLRFPPQWYSYDYDLNVINAISMGGTAYSIDKEIGSDSHITELPLVLNRINAARLINYLVVTGRKNLTVIPPANSYIFGRLNDGTASYACKWLDDEIVINAPINNRFTFTLRLYRESQS